MPSERKPPGHRSFASKEELYPAPPISKVGKAHYHLFADSQELLKNFFGIFYCLHCLRQDHIIEALVTVISQPLLDILLYNRYPSADAIQHKLLVKLDTFSLYIFVTHKIGQQLSVTTADVKHSAVWLNERSNQLVIYACPVCLLKLAKLPRTPCIARTGLLCSLRPVSSLQKAADESAQHLRL